MAQDFVGSNNVNLLVPSGQFGTRLEGGADAASPRYIFTLLSSVARCLFPEIDDILLTQREDDGQLIEPEFYCPVIPLLLVNGTQGIGTGWSTFVPPHDPLSVLDYVRAKLDNEESLPSLRPFARGFTGTIELKESGGGFQSIGRAHRLDERTVLIDELPIGCWTNSYKEVLLKMRNAGTIQDVIENHTTSKVSFTVRMNVAQLNRLERAGLEKSFRLIANLPTTNMHAFDANCTIRKFDSAESVVDVFFPIRLELYNDRKSVLESESKHAATMFRNRARFIEAVTTGKIDLISGRKSKDDTAAALSAMGFATAADLTAIRNNNVVWERRHGLDLVPTESDDNPSDSSYDYLLSMPLYSLTSEKILEQENQADKKESELKNIIETTAKDLWRNDLDRLAPLL